LKWWLYRNPIDTTRVVWGGSGFGGQVPLAIPEDDMVIVFNAWNIVPGQRALPLRQVLPRLLNAVKDRGPSASR
jgi:hypothetical protein